MAIRTENGQAFLVTDDGRDFSTRTDIPYAPSFLTEKEHIQLVKSLKAYQAPPELTDEEREQNLNKIRQAIRDFKKRPRR